MALSGSTRTALDVALAAALSGWAAVDTWMATDDQPALRSAIAAATALALVLRRRTPAVAALWFATGMALESLATEAPDEEAILLACVVMAFSVAAHAPLRESLLGAGLLVLAISVAIVTDPSDSPGNIVPTAALFIAAPYAVGLTLRRRQQDVVDLTRETERLAAEAEAAVAEERRRIARELHDVVSHAVTLVAVQAEAGQAVIDTDPDAARRNLDAIGRVSREALAELHRLLAVLRDDETATAEPGLARLEALVEGVRAAGLAVALEASTSGPLDPETDRCAYRVVQEALTNALRHTGRATADVRVASTPTGLEVAVRTEGLRHVSSYGGTGRGLSGLAERVAALGGTFRSGPVGEHGFEVVAVLP